MLEETRCGQTHCLSNSISIKYAAGERVKAKSILLLDHVSVCSSGDSDILKELKNLFIVSNFEDLTTLRSINASDTEEVRHWLQSFFTPKNKGSLSVNYCGTVRKIEYYCSRFKDNRINIFSPLAFSLTLTCPDPWFYGVDEHTTAMVETVPLLTFPFNSLQGVGITSGAGFRSTEVEINNIGDDEIGLVVEITANGAIVDPYIESGTRRVQAKCSLEANDVIVFSTVPLKKDIIINGEGNTPYYRGSEFFSIPPGKSTLRVGAASGASNATTEIYYSFKYMGV